MISTYRYRFSGKSSAADGAQAQDTANMYLTYPYAGIAVTFSPGFSPCSMSVLNKQFAVPVCILASIHHSRLIPLVLNRCTFFTKPSIAVLLPDSKRYFNYFPPLSAYPGSYIRKMLKFAL